MSTPNQPDSGAKSPSAEPAQTAEPAVALVAGDIVNNCNLRCPFCLVDYANIRRLTTMPMDLFKRTFAMLPHVARGHMWLSCLHEPTLHPEFIEMIEAVPPGLRDRISFTTNFCKRLPDEMLERLALSGIAQVRVSFDTDDPDLFRALRVGGRWEVFKDNLLRFRAILARHTVRPSLHFITMAFRDNAASIPGLVQRGVDVYGGDTHEVRFIYYFPHVAEWGEEHVLSLDGWRTIEKALAPGVAAQRVALAGPQAGVWDDFKEKRGLAEYVHTETSFGAADNAIASPAPSPAEVARNMPDEPLRLRLRWDGLMVIEQIPEHLCRFNLANIADPGTYFAEIRSLARRT
ncbi:MAG TPA: radical SAM protein [Opitutaceae bacterium]|nr:radical SAM protein [Opitutaceae bacterium]